MSCTWKGCRRIGERPLIDRSGEEWAFLCLKHAEALKDALFSEDPKKVTSAWAKAGHGHPRREFIVASSTTLGRFIELLKKLKKD